MTADQPAALPDLHEISLSLTCAVPVVCLGIASEARINVVRKWVGN
jgi:hypothetical protein